MNKMWDPVTEAENLRREIQIARALIEEATKVADLSVMRRLNQVALMHLEQTTSATHATA